MASTYHPYWGKAFAPHGTSDYSWHPVAYHSLDVAATLQAYLHSNPAIRGRLAKLSALPEDQACVLCIFLAGLHDIGKFGPAFQGKIAELFAVLFPGATRVPELPATHHTNIGLTFLLNYFCTTWAPHLAEKKALRLLEPLANAAAGHHGLPTTDEYAISLSGSASRAATEFVTDFGALLGSPVLPQSLLDHPERLRNFSWLAAGLITLCDWIGSSTQFFPYCADEIGLADYWQTAQAKAATAIIACRQTEKPGQAHLQFDTLFGKARPAPPPGYLPKQPTPLQRYADTIPLPAIPQPTLFILEDETGAGKTEAALTLAGRLVSGGFARGVFFSLPTQATANAVFQRILPVYERFFEGNERPTLTLAHGSAKLALERLSPAPQTLAGDQARELAAWAQERSKTALLADFGVGTVDQVVMAGLPTRHSVLRQLGLAQKVLIIDEAHACDQYLLGLLRNTLTQHARLGGSAIILSATLPAVTKQKLAQAFAAGLGSPLESICEHPAYPLATALWDGHCAETAIPARGDQRTLQFSRILEKAAFAKIRRWLEEGKCVCLLRNTVRAAQESYDWFSARFAEDSELNCQVDLVHARFMAHHRNDNDRQLLDSFGKDSTTKTRAGRLVIATQVAEQSLDVDFDEMVTDLAPLDCLLQRAGRRHRHIRDKYGDPALAEGRDPSPLYVITPSTGSPASFLKDLPAGTALVYPMPGVLWRTAQVVNDWASLQIPTQVREAIEFTYGDAEIPEELQVAECDALGARYGATQQAQLVSTDWTTGYSRRAGLTATEDCVTRLGDPTVRVVLCTQQGIPLMGEGPQNEALSQIQIRAALIEKPCADGDGRVWLRMAGDLEQGFHAATTSRDGAPRMAYYSKERGFSIEQ